MKNEKIDQLKYSYEVIIGTKMFLTYENLDFNLFIYYFF